MGEIHSEHSLDKVMVLVSFAKLASVCGTRLNTQRLTSQWLPTCWRSLAGWMVAGVVASVGCNPPPRPVLGKNQSVSSVEILDQSRGDSQDDGVQPQQPFTAAWETWQAYYIGNRHVGYSHIKMEPLADSPENLISVKVEDQLSIRRGPATVIQRLDQTTLETQNGELVSFEAELRVGPALTRYSGAVQGDSLNVVITRGTKKTTQTVPWQSSYHGPAGLQSSLFAKPMERGEQRRLKTLLPIRFDVATLELDCRHIASISMPDGAVHRAREIEVTMKVENSPPINTVLWIDDQGRVIKTLTPGLDLTAFDSSGAAAVQGIVASDDILTATSVEIEGVLDNPLGTKTSVFRISPRTSAKKSEDASAFVPQPGQWVKKNEAGDYEVFVSRDPAAIPPTGFRVTALAPTTQDSRSGALVDSAHPLVKQLAETAIARKNDQARLAYELSRSTHSLVRQKNYTRGFVPASEVARASEGDCTAHAVLLAAMLRARGIPARVAVGLVYVPTDTKPQMAYHMWTIAYINDQWLHFDATLPSGYAPADRITLVTDSLDGGNEYDLLGPVLGTIGQYNIALIEAETGSIVP